MSPGLPKSKPQIVFVTIALLFFLILSAVRSIPTSAAEPYCLRNRTASTLSTYRKPYSNKQVSKGLQNSKAHVMGVDFHARAEDPFLDFGIAERYSYANSKDRVIPKDLIDKQIQENLIAKNKNRIPRKYLEGIFLDATNNSDALTKLVFVEIYDDVAKQWRKLSKVNPKYPGQIPYFFPSKPPREIRFYFGKNTKPTYWTTNHEPPPGFRIRLNSKEMINKGFAGGHTEQTFAKEKAIYSDLIEETSSKPFHFYSPGAQETIRGRQVKYRFAGKDVKPEKTIIESESSLLKIEKQLEIKIKKILPQSDSRESLISTNFDVIIDGKPSKLPVNVRVSGQKKDGTPNILSWWLNP